MNDSPNRGVLFDEVQQFRHSGLWIPLTAAAFLLWIILLLSFDLLPVSGVMPEAWKPLTRVMSSCWLPMLLLAMGLVRILKLTVRLSPRALHIRYFPFIRKEISLHEISSFEATTERPRVDKFGYGIKHVGKWTRYNVSGKWGILFHLPGERRLFLGTKKPEAFAEALRRAKGQTS